MKTRATVLVVLALLSGCDDMAKQPNGKRYSREAQVVQPVEGIVAFNSKPATSPKLDIALIERGQDRFRIYCTPCHGELGDGNGMIVQRGFPKPPSYHIERLRDAPTQHFYDVITAGYGAMYSFAGRVAPPDRWAIAAYIRALQVSQNGTAADVTPGKQAGR